MHLGSKYSQTRLKRPPLGPQNIGHWKQVVVAQSSFKYLKFKMGPHNGSRCRQVVAIRRWSSNQVYLNVQRNKLRIEFVGRLKLPARAMETKKRWESFLKFRSVAMATHTRMLPKIAATI